MTKITTAIAVLLIALAASTSVAMARHVPTLSAAEAHYLASRAITRVYGGPLPYKKIGGCTRASRVKRRCAAQWVTGDFQYNGRVTIWLTRPDAGKAVWHYKIKATRFDEYCAYVQHRPPSSCIKQIDAG